jgi:hypothetical protein
MKRLLFMLPAFLLLASIVPSVSAQVSVGAYGDYLHVSQTDTNMAGLGGRLGVNVFPGTSFEAQMSYDFDQTFREGFTSTSGGSLTFANSDMKVLTGLFGPKIQTRGRVKIFLTLKGGFIHFAFNPAPGSLSGFTSTVSDLRTSNVKGMLYPGGGLEADLGPVGLRLDVGDDIYFANGAHHNLAVQFGPVIHF